MSFSFTVAIAANCNVPRKQYGVVISNGAAAQRTEASIIIGTELWEQTHQFWRGVHEQYEPMPSPWAHTTHEDSASLGWDTSVWERVDHGVTIGGASPWIPGICDRRDLPWALLRHKQTGRKLLVISVHTAPVRPKTGWRNVLAAQAAHARCRRTLRRRVNRSPYLVLIAGDFNTKRLMPRALLAGDTIDNGIVHAELFNGVHARFGAVRAKRFKINSDHPGVRLEIPVYGK